MAHVVVIIFHNNIINLNLTFKNEIYSVPKSGGGGGGAPAPDVSQLLPSLSLELGDIACKMLIELRKLLLLHG